jgi:hypothetical protein
MASSGFELCKFYMLLFDDGGRPPKHVAGNTICIHTTLFGCASNWFFIIRNNYRIWWKILLEEEARSITKIEL